MDRLTQFRIFFAIADHGSFAEAARRLSISPTTATRTISALEASLGIALFVRTTRSIRLTEEGGRLLERTRPALSALDNAMATVHGANSEPRGTLVITAPVTFGRLHILPIVTNLLLRYPTLDIRLLLLDRVARMVDEGIDVAVRIAELPDSSLHAVRIGNVRHVLSASPAYLADHGTPISPSDLMNHILIDLEGARGPHNEWRFGDEQASRVRISPRLRVNSADAAIAAALAHLGIVQTLSYQVADARAAGRLQPVLEPFASATIPVSLVFQRGRRKAPNVNVFIDAAKHHFRNDSIG